MAWYDIQGMQNRGQRMQEDHLSKIASRKAQADYQTALLKKMQRENAPQNRDEGNLGLRQAIAGGQAELDGMYQNKKIDSGTYQAALKAMKNGQMGSGLSAWLLKNQNPDRQDVRMQSMGTGDQLQQILNEKALYKEETGREFNDAPWTIDSLRGVLPWARPRESTAQFEDWLVKHRGQKRPTVNFNNPALQQAEMQMKQRRGR